MINATEEECFERLGTPITNDLSYVDGRPLPKGFPSQVVKTAEWTTTADISREEIKVIDFGDAFLMVDQPVSMVQPPPLRVPEFIFQQEFDYRADLWLTGCMVSEHSDTKLLLEYSLT